MKTGFQLLRDAATNKSTAFTSEERDRLGLRGLLPAKVSDQGMQVTRVLENLRRKTHDIEKYIFLLALQGRNERLYYKTLTDNIEELLPIVYTPTVGQACKEFAHIFRKTRGFYVTANDRGKVSTILKNWPHEDVRVIVVTDGERILGLGDLGANGMGISIGKLSLYTAGAGIPPEQCMPVQIDVGTNNKELLGDPLYLGVAENRIDGTEYFDLLDEFIQAVQERFPKALIQFEDFLTPKAYALLNKYRDQILCFNDDIQGTAAVALAGIYASNRITRHKFKDLRIMFLGAGSAATGIADLLVDAYVKEGLTREEAYQRLWFVDVNGLLVKDRSDLMPHNEPFAKSSVGMTFKEAVEHVKPHVLIGATGVPKTFTEEIVSTMGAQNERPVIFALSNPTSRAECTAAQAYEWTQGKVVFASGSPFPAVKGEGNKEWRPAQGNNAYVFPGIGLGAVGCEARRINSEMFLAAADVLAQQVSQGDLDSGSLYPPLSQLPEVSLKVAIAVAEVAYEYGLARLKRPESLQAHLESIRYQTSY